MEDFVPYELALKLKDKGFRKPCIATYDKDGMLGYNYVQPTSIHAVGFEECLVYSNDCVMAPTISQVLKWLFNEKQLFVSIDCLLSDGFGLFFSIYKKDEYIWRACGFDDNYYNKPEEAALAGIKYILDNLI